MNQSSYSRSYYVVNLPLLIPLPLSNGQSGLTDGQVAAVTRNDKNIAQLSEEIDKLIQQVRFKNVQRKEQKATKAAATRFHTAYSRINPHDACARELYLLVELYLLCRTYLR